MPNIRLTFFAIFVVCLLSMLAALYMQYVLDLIPCAMCMVQRIMVIAVGLWALIAGIHNPHTTGRRIYSAIGLLLVVIGGYFSFSHVVLQYFPSDEESFTCNQASLGYLIDTLGGFETIKRLLNPAKSCSFIDGEFLGLSIPAWTLVLFVILGCAYIVQFFRKPAPNA